MKTNLQPQGTTQESQTKVEALTTIRCTEFLIGWTKRFGSTLNLFVFPFDNKEHPNL